MSKGCARNSKLGCGDHAVGQAVRIDDILWFEQRPALMFEFRACNRLFGNYDLVITGFAATLPSQGGLVTLGPTSDSGLIRFDPFPHPSH
jgi:hypothetical protein